MNGKRALVALGAAVSVLLAGLVAAPPTQAATSPDKRKCVTAYELKKTVKGTSRNSVYALLDGSGTRRTSTIRAYTRCEYKATVLVYFTKSTAYRSAKVLKVVQVVPKKPAAPAAQYRTIVGAPQCQAQVVQTFYQKRTATMVFVRSVWRWVPSWSAWVTYKTTSRPTTVAECAPEAPAPRTETRVVDGPATCNLLTVQTLNQKRVSSWAWDATSGAWVETWGPWTTTSNGSRTATAKDCVNEVSTIPGDALLPDIRIKSLNKCGKGDLDATNGTCFLIDPSAPPSDDFPALAGKKLLKFPVITMNVGDGPAEVIADRTGTNAADWASYQTFYRPDGTRESVKTSAVEFYFAGDGHNHWHFRDFDNYLLESLDGTTVARAEKHGYCLQDNTTYTPFVGLPGVPSSPLYPLSTTCGAGLPNALTIIEGLSKGWGDTYPTTLPDQAIDITGVPDGRYRVVVEADAIGAVVETSNANNVASIEISISGNTVTTYPETATGGLG
jgi:hypothetical protein